MFARKGFALLLALLPATAAWAQSDSPAVGSPAAGSPAVGSPWLYVGPRVAVAGEIAKPADFNADIQRFYPSASSYFPVYSQIGVEVAERVSLAGSGYRLSFREQVLVAGLDQNFALPVFRILLGVLTPFGLEAAIGPQLELGTGSSTAGVSPSLIYSLGWRFSLGAVSVPVFVVADPLPPNRKVRVSVMAGVDYGFSPARPTPNTPFNY